MPGGALTRSDRRPLAVCAFVALAAVVGVALLWRVAPGSFALTHPDLVRWVGRVGVQVPACAALAAVVLTGRPFVGVAIAAASAVLATVFGVASLSGSGLILGVTDYAAWVGWSLLAAGALLAADLLALRRGRFTAVRGAVAGLLVALVALAIQTLSLVAGSGFDLFEVLPTDFWVWEYAGRLVALVLTGLVAGAVAERARGAQVGSGARVPVD